MDRRWLSYRPLPQPRFWTDCKPLLEINSTTHDLWTTRTTSSGKKDYSSSHASRSNISYTFFALRVSLIENDLPFAPSSSSGSPLISHWNKRRCMVVPPNLSKWKCHLVPPWRLSQVAKGKHEGWTTTMIYFLLLYPYKYLHRRSCFHLSEKKRLANRFSDYLIWSMDATLSAGNLETCWESPHASDKREKSARILSQHLQYHCSLSTIDKLQTMPSTMLLPTFSTMWRQNATLKGSICDTPNSFRTVSIVQLQFSTRTTNWNRWVG